MLSHQEPLVSADRIPDALKVAFRQFNEAIGTSYSEATVKIGYFTFDNFPTVFKNFCEHDFPSWLNENYTNPSYWSDMQASAYVEGNKAGILINTSIPFTFSEWTHDLTHELSHIYATQNEYLGRSFYNAHCRDEGVSIYEDTIYIGYAVWREFIAEFITAFASPHELLQSISVFMPDIREFDLLIRDVSKDGLRAVSLILSALFTCREYMYAQSKEEFFEMLTIRKPVSLEKYGKLISFIFDKVNDKKSEPHIIDVEFMDTLGSLVRFLISNGR